MNENVHCPGCSHIYKGHTNIFGKVCIHCGTFMPTDVELPIVQENKRAKHLLTIKLRKYLEQRKNANINR